MPTLARDRLGRRAAVARQHDDLQAFRVERANRFRRGRFDRVGHADQPRRRPSTATNITVSPCRRFASARRDRGRPARRRSSASICALPTATRRPSTRPLTPLPVTDLKSLHSASSDATVARAGDDRRGQRMLADVLDAGGEAQQSSSAIRRAARRTTSVGLPSVSVPVLSTTIVSTCSSSSSASALRRSTPSFGAPCRCRP